MTKTMADLRREVARRLRETLHGREIDTLEKGHPEIEHMLGIVTLGAISTPACETGTILDPGHEFWDQYYQDINTTNGVKSEVKTAMQSLKDDDIFRVSSPYGDDAGILYVEVDPIEDDVDPIVTSCIECGANVRTETDLSVTYDRYVMRFNIDCPECDYSETVGRDLYTQ